MASEVADLSVNDDGVFVGAGSDAEQQILAATAPIVDVNAFFVLVSGFLLSAGSIRSKNAKNIILKNLLDACFGAIFFYLIGFGFAYGGDFDDQGKGGKFIGWSHFALDGVDPADYYFWFFQFAFAATAATIVSGAVAERTKFEGYLAYAVFLTSWVYPVVAHWVWSGRGWASAFREDDKLLDVGAIDFAGCGVVHMTGGLAGLAGAWAVGPRIGRFDADGKPQAMPGHNASLAILGVFILWFGWYGFNPGSALAIIDSSGVAALCAVTTTLSAAAGTISTLLTLMIKEYLASGHVMWDLIGASNGTLGGLVGITAACSVVEPWAAIIIGLTSGVVYVCASWIVSHALKIDDPLDAAAVHGFCGAWGLLMAAAFADKDRVRAAYGDGMVDDYNAYGFITGGNGRLLGCAVILILVITAWVLVQMVPFFLVLNAAGLLRVSEEDEREGLDVSHHGGSAYEAENLMPSKGAANGGDLAGRVELLAAEVAALKKHSKE